MPRLLLVDDNQRIHQIVETLLTATDIELTCASSGAQALELLASSGPFDVALLDTTMLGMDGWELLDKVRRTPATALMPVAMMAGVLDVVDPETVRKAPIQGFLKKPVELRDLADRIRTLIATPVEPPEPVPNLATIPYFRLSDHPLPDASDLLILEPGDVLEAAPEEPATQEPATQEPAFEEPGMEMAALAAAEPSLDSQMDSLELEELDLESLKGLAPATEETLASPLPEELVTLEETGAMPDLSPEDAYQDSILDLGVVTDELPDLGPEMPVEAEDASTQAMPIRPDLLEPAMTLDWSDDSDTLLEMAHDTRWAEPAPANAVASAMEQHPDFDPDSFLDQEPGPDPTPAFLPEIPEYVTPTQFAELPEAGRLEEAAAPSFLEPEPERPEELTTVLDGDVEFLDEAPAMVDAEPELLEEAPAISAEPELLEEAPAALEAEPELLEEAPAILEAEPELLEEAHAIPAEPIAPAAGYATVPPWASTQSLVDEPAAAPAAEGAADPLAALLSDPVLMERLTKAVVARLGDQVLREIAWEVMPEMADRMHRN